MKPTFEKIRSLVVAGALALVAACSSGNQGGPAGRPIQPGESGASVSACCRVDSPVNQTVPNTAPPPAAFLNPVQAFGGTVSFSGFMSGLPGTAPASAARVMIFADIDPASGVGDYEWIVLDTGPTFDPVGTECTDPEGAGACGAYPAATNNGVSLTGTFIGGNQPTPGADNCSSAAGTAVTVAMPAGVTAALAADGTSLAAGATWGDGGAVVACQGAIIQASGTSGRSWFSAAPLAAGAASLTYKVVFLDSAGNLLNSGTSTTVRADLNVPSVAATSPSLSDIFISNDATAPVVTIAPDLPASSGPLFTGNNLQPLPFAAVSWSESNEDLSITAGNPQFAATNRNLRATNIDTGDVITVAEGGNQGFTVVVDDLEAAPNVANANNDPSFVPITDVFSSDGQGDTYSIFHGSVRSEREREDNAGAACNESPGVNCVDDSNFNAARASSVFVQGQVTDAASNIAQVVVRAVNTTQGNLENEQPALLFRNVTKATHQWRLFQTNNLLVVGRTAGANTTDGGTAPDLCVTLANNAGTAAVTVGAVACANEVTVDLDAVTVVGGPESLDGDLNDVVNAINIGRPANETVSSGTESVMYTSVARNVEQAGDIKVVYTNTLGPNAGDESNPATPNTVVSSVVVNTAASPDDITITIELGNDVSAPPCPCPIDASGADIAAAVAADLTARTIVTASETVVGVAAAMLANTVGDTGLPAEDSAAAALVRASLFNGSDGSAAAIAEAALDLIGGTDAPDAGGVTAEGANTSAGRLASSNPKITVGLVAPAGTPGAGLCLPAFLNPVRTVGAPFFPVDTHTDVCFAGQLNATEGVLRFEVDATDVAGNQILGEPVDDAGAVLVTVARDTAPAFLDTNAGATPAAAAVVPTFCETPEFDNEPVCVSPADVVSAGTSYETFASSVAVGGKVRDFLAGRTTYDTNGTFATSQGDSGRVYVRVTTDNGYDSFALTADAIANPVPYVNGDPLPAAENMGEFNYDNIPLRLGGVTNVTLTLWDQASNITTVQFSVTQISVNTETAPSLAVDCVTDNSPRAVGALVPCPEDTDSLNPNAPIHTRLGTFGDPGERGAAATTYTNNFIDQLRYNTGGVLTSFGVNFTPPIDQRVIAADQVSFRGRFLTLEGTPPGELLVNGQNGKTVSFLPGHGAEAGEYPIGFATTVTAGGNGTNCIEIPLTVGGRGTPADDVATQRDEQLRAGDYLALAADPLNPLAQSANVGLYRIVALQQLGAGCAAPGGACVPGVTECQTIFLDRTLPQDAANMEVRAEFIWFTPTPLPLSEEGVNSFQFLARDALGNERSLSFSVLRDFQPPALVVEGVLDGFSTFSMTPEVFITDQTLFLGGVDPTAVRPAPVVLTTPATYIAVSRTDSNGLDTQGDAYETGYALFADDITTGPPINQDRTAVAFDISDDTGAGDPFTIPAGDAAPGGATDWPTNAAITAAAPGLFPSTVLGTTKAASLQDSGTAGAQVLNGDLSCVQTPPSGCPAGLPISYRLEVNAADHAGLDAQLVVNADIVEAAVDRLLAGAIGIISTNPAVINLLADNTDLDILTLDQLSLSGTLYNMNLGLSQLLGSPSDTPASNPQATFYAGPSGNGAREAFGVLLGTILQDPDGDPNQGSPATAVTLSNVIRILADNGVLDDLLPIIDNVNILNPQTGAPTRTGDFSRSQTFLRNLLIDQSLLVSCGTDQDQTAQECFTTEGVIKETFPMIKAALDFGDLIANPSALAASRKRTLANAVIGSRSRITGETLDLNTVPGFATDAAAAADVSFLPMDSTDAAANPTPGATDCETDNPTPPNFTPIFDEPIEDAICRSVVNVQPGDILIIRAGGADGASCDGVARRVIGYADSAARDTVPVDPFPAACVAACDGDCAYEIVHPNGPSLNPVLELADTLTFGVPGNGYDNLTSGGGATADETGGERELTGALFHMLEEGMLNDPAFFSATVTFNQLANVPVRSLVCPETNGATGDAACAAATTADRIDDAESFQAVLDMLTELSDDQNAANGDEFITQLVKIVKDLLKNNPPIPANASGTTVLESLYPVVTDLLDDGTGRKTGAAGDIGGLLTTPDVTNVDLVALGVPGTDRRNTRLNLLMRSAWWLADGSSIAPVDVDLDASGALNAPREFQTSRPIVAILPLLRAITNDPDNNPRGIFSTGGGGTVFVSPFDDVAGPLSSVADRLMSPMDQLLNDSRLPALLSALGDVLDPGTGISDFTAFDYAAASISESPFTTTEDVNPFSVNPPLLRILSDISSTTIDVNADGADATDEATTEALTRMLNILLEPVGPEGEPSTFDVNVDNDGVPVDTDVCNEGFFAGRTSMEILLTVVSQMLTTAEKDPRDYDFTNRTFPDANGTGNNRSLLRIILDNVFDDPNTDEDSLEDDVDGYPGNPTAGAAFPGGASGTRDPVLGGDNITVPQSTLDILPELLNTIARFGFDDNDPAAPLTSIFANCAGACPVNDGNSVGPAQRILSNQRVGIDLALQLDAPFQIGSAPGVIRFEESLVREAIESLSNLSTTDAINQVLVLVSKMEEDIQPINGTTSVPNPTDVSRSASAIRALADPDGDGDPSNDGVLDDLIPIVQVIPASGQTQQVLDLLRALRGCGYDTSSSPAIDIRGGELLKEQENTFLALLDAYSGATNVLSLDGGTAECPAAASRGSEGGILDSNPLFAGGRSTSTFGTLLGGSGGESAVAGAFTDASKDFRALGVGPNAHLCIRTSVSPFNEECAVINARPGVGTEDTINYNNPGLGAFDLDAFIAANCNGTGPVCSYRVRMMREPFNGCVGGVQIGGQGLGYNLSSFGVGGITPNAFSDARLDLLLRSLAYLVDGGNSPVAVCAGTGLCFLDRLETLLDAAVQDNQVTADPSIAKNFLFGTSGTQGSEEGPIQGLLNDDPARAALTAFLTLFGQLTTSPADPAVSAAQDARDTYPDFVALSEWSQTDNACAAGTCDGNAIHDAVDYQFLALQGIMQVLGNQDGQDGGPTPGIGCDVFGRFGVPNYDSSVSIQDGHCDDPEVLFAVLSGLIQNDDLSNLFPGLQIIMEATNALGVEPNIDGLAPGAWPANPVHRDLRLNVIRGHQTQINRDALADIIQRSVGAASGDPVIMDLLDDGTLNASFAGAYPEAFLVVNDLGGALPNNDSGILEGPQQILVRGIYQLMLEYLGEVTADCDDAGAAACTINDQNGYGARRDREVGLEELLARLSGARATTGFLDQALTILRGIAVDKAHTEGDNARDIAGLELAGEVGDTPGDIGFTQRDIGPILSVNAGLAARGVVDASAPYQSAMDVIGDFLVTLLEDPTDCDAATNGKQRYNTAGLGPAEGACPVVDDLFVAGVPTFTTRPNYTNDVDSVFRDTGVTVERPIQPVLDESVFDSLSELFAGGDQSTIVGALPFLGAFINEQLGFAIQRNGDFTEYVYCTPPGCTTEDRIADTLLADLQTLIPGSSTGAVSRADNIARFDPLLTDDHNRNGVVGDGPLTGTGASTPTNDFDADCVAIAETDNTVIDCIQPGALLDDGDPTNDWGQADLCGARCDAVFNAGDGRPITAIGFTAVDGVVTLSRLEGFDAALIDGIADLIANEDPARAVNNQSNRTSSAREFDTFTQRTVIPTQAVDPDFISLLNALGDLLISTNTQ